MSASERDAFLPMPSTTSKARPKVGPGPPRFLQRKSYLVIFVTVSAFLTIPLLRRIQLGICHSSPFLADSRLCPATPEEEWDLFYHLGGNGPWIPMVDGVNYSGTVLPKGCSVDQVHMVREAFR